MIDQTCNILKDYLPNQSLNDNILPESESPGRTYNCQTGPRFKRERIRSEIADYVLLMLGAPSIEIELDKQQLSLAVNESLKIFEEWAPDHYFQYYSFVASAGQSVYKMPCDVGMIRDVTYAAALCDGASELGGSMPLGWIGDTGYGAGGLAWGAWGYNRWQPYWGYAGEWVLFKQYEEMFERLSSRNGGWEYFEDLHSIKIYPTPSAGGGIVTVHYLQNKKDWAEVHQFMNEYSLALSKIMLGRIRSKYSSILSAGEGVQLDGDRLLEEGKTEKLQLEKDLIYKWNAPQLPFIMG
jgi:hypothetical protein